MTMTASLSGVSGSRYVGYEALALSRKDDVLRVGLNRPAKRNAIHIPMTLELERLCHEAMRDTSLKAMVIHGVGEHFCAGMDMKAFFDHSDHSEEELRRARAATDNWRARLLRRLPCTLISSVRGYCLGGALPIIECSDIVLASSDTVFGLPEINFGFVPGGPIAKSTLRALSRKAASYVALTGRPFTARQAFAWGMASKVVNGDPLSEALEIASDLPPSHHADRYLLTQMKGQQ